MKESGAGVISEKSGIKVSGNYYSLSTSQRLGWKTGAVYKSNPEFSLSNWDSIVRNDI